MIRNEGGILASLTLAEVSVLPTLEALCAAAWASRGWASRLGRDRRLGAFQVATLVPRRTGCVCINGRMYVECAGVRVCDVQK